MWPNSDTLENVSVKVSLVVIQGAYDQFFFNLPEKFIQDSFESYLTI